MPRVRTVPANEVTGKAREIYDKAGNYGSFSSLVGVMANLCSRRFTDIDDLHRAVTLDTAAPTPPLT